LRLGRRQSEIQRFARDLFRLKAEIMAEKYDVEMLSQITGQEITKEMLQVMQQDGPRGFKIDIETDSTIMVDEKAEQENVAKLLQAIAQYIQGIAPAIQAGMFSKEAAQSMLLMVVRKFRGSREVEEVINAMSSEEGSPEQALQQAQQQIAQMQQQMQQVQEQAQQQIEKLGGELEAAQGALAAAEDRREMDQQKHDLDREAAQQEMTQESELHQLKMNQLRAVHDQKMEQNRLQNTAKLMESAARKETTQ
jgi:vacuolar-type H+-ATPase subunit I/STV1